MANQALLLTLEKQMNETKAKLEAITVNNDMFFLIVNGMIVYFMQCGFAFLECGAVRAKNATNILMKNILDSFIGAIAYWTFGYAFAFGTENVFIGASGFINNDVEDSKMAFWFFQFVFAATAATIVSGALAERCDFAAYLIYSVVITGFVYPVVTHWAWSSSGWLAAGVNFEFNNVTETATYQDFAGSGVVHLVGGMAALAGAAILGKRLGRWDEEGNVQNIPGHSIPMASLGGFILFFGFFAFNGGSQLQISAPGDGEAVSIAVVNTILSAAFSAILAMVVYRIISLIKGSSSKWSLLITVNGGLSGMVAICASCNAVHGYGAAIIGAVAGVNYLLWSAMVLKMGVDDPLDAVAVHAGAGLWGVLAAPILSKGTGIVYMFNKKSLMGLLWNVVGVGAIIAWSAGVSALVFGLLHLFRIFRVDPEIERRGLDIPKHGEPAYPTKSYGDGWSVRPMEADTLKERCGGIANAGDSNPPNSQSWLDTDLPYTIDKIPEYATTNGTAKATTKM